MGVELCPSLAGILHQGDCQGCAENLGKPVKTIFNLVEMEDNEGRELLQMSHAQFMEPVWVCKHFPNINCAHDVLDSYHIFTRETVTLQVTLEREMEGRQEVSLFDASRFPKPKEEGWWLVISDRKSNHSAGYQLCITATKGETEIGFCSTNCFGKQTYTLHVQACLECDQEYEFTIDVKEAVDDAEDGKPMDE